MMKNRIIPFLLLTMVGLPIIAAFFLFHNPQYLSGKSTAQGKLIMPPLDARSLVGEVDSWQLLLFVDKECAAECLQLIYYAQQIHKALAKDSGRVRRGLLLKENLASYPVALQRLVQTQAPHLDIHIVTEENLREVFALTLFSERDLLNSVFVVDPNSNLMLQHQHITDTRAAKALLQDLKKLLKISRIG